MITGSLQKKKGLYYAVLNLYDDYGKRKPKWIPTGYTIKWNKKIKLVDLKPKHVQDFFDLLFSEGLSGNTIKHYRANISKALKS